MSVIPMQQQKPMNTNSKTNPDGRSPIVVFVDVDGVCADLMTEWVRRYNRDFEDALTPEDFTTWSVGSHVKPQAKEQMWGYLHDQDLYENVQPIEGALAGVCEMRRRGYRVVFATSTNLYQSGAKLRWLVRHGFLVLEHGTISKDYIEVHDKSLLCGDALVDDGPHNLAGFLGFCVLYAAPHNTLVSAYPRPRNWQSVLRHLDCEFYREYPPNLPSEE